jgi:hypothetical protein
MIDLSVRTIMTSVVPLKTLKSRLEPERSFQLLLLVLLSMPAAAYGVRDCELITEHNCNNDAVDKGKAFVSWIYTSTDNSNYTSRRSSSETPQVISAGPDCFQCA